MSVEEKTDKSEKSESEKSYSDNWIRDAWSTYGGWKSLIRSNYFYLSLIITACCYNLWTKAGWWDLVISVLPSILGFSLAGMAIMLAFGSERFQKILVICQTKNKPSPFMAMASSYSIFIFAQVSGIVSAILFKALYFPPLDFIPDCMGEFLYDSRQFFWAFGWFLLCYSLMQLVAALSWIFRVCQLYAKYQNKLFEKMQSKSPTSR